MKKLLIVLSFLLFIFACQPVEKINQIVFDNNQFSNFNILSSTIEINEIFEKKISEPYIGHTLKVSPSQRLINWINESINTQKEYKINILVGCKNTRENDYDRFEDNNFYSFYIDIDLEEDKFDLEKEYNMFTIDYNDIDERFPKSSISNIHFDTGTSNFASIEYLDFAEKVLKKEEK